MGPKDSARRERRSKARNDPYAARTNAEEEVLAEVLPEKAEVVEIPGTAIIIRGLDQTTSFKQLESRMSEFGEVVGTHIIRRKKSDWSVSVFAIYIMEREEDAEAAVSALKATTEWSVTLVD